MRRTNASLLVKNRFQRGFTIVELLIVVVVIAILAAITIVAYSGIQQQARSSALASEMSQLQKTIQTDLVKSIGDAPSINAPLAYLTVTGEGPLAKPVENAQQGTIYAVFDTHGTTATSWSRIAALNPHSNNDNGFAFRTSGPGVDSVNGFYATSSISNRSITISGIRSTSQRHVCWTTALVGEVRAGCNDDTSGLAQSISAHTGWNFSTIILTSSTDITAIATLAFAEHHDEVTRGQMVRWLVDEY